MRAQVPARRAAPCTKRAAAESLRRPEPEIGMSQQEFRIGLVGCGRISKNHFDAIGRIDGLTLAAVGDIDVERARSAGETYGVPWFKSLDEMLAAGAFDMVAVCTP